MNFLRSQRSIIVIEEKQTDHPSLFFGLKDKGYKVEIAKNGANALKKMKDVDPALIVIDAASLRTSGKRIVYSVKKIRPEMPVIVVIDDSFADNSVSSRADMVLTLPFTIQKLVNRINIFLSNEESNNFVRSGQVSLNLENDVVKIENRKPIALTPKTAQILSTFMANPLRVITRDELIERIWNTDYVADMRSLDVHIHWLREAIEIKPRSPKYLITVRGAGYYFNPEGTGKIRPESNTDEVVENA